MEVFSTDIPEKIMFINNVKLCVYNQKECQKCIFQQSGDLNFKIFFFLVHLGDSSWGQLPKQTVKNCIFWENRCRQKCLNKSLRIYIYIYIYIIQMLYILYIYIFICILSCPKTNIGSLMGRQPHSLNVYHSTIISSTKSLPGVS